jgi:hypothetical protein
MTNGFGHEAYEVEEPRKGTGKARNRKVERPVRKADQTVRPAASSVREHEPRRS